MCKNYYGFKLLAGMCLVHSEFFLVWRVARYENVLLEIFWKLAICNTADKLEKVLKLKSIMKVDLY